MVYTLTWNKLLQRASTVVRATQSKPIVLNVQLLPELPNGFSGRVRNAKIQPPKDVERIFLEYSRDEPIMLDVDVCPQGTVGNIRALDEYRTSGR
jgi:hypothetical protein